MTIDECRPKVKAFAVAMEKRLLANDHKGGWGRCELAWLAARMVEEAGELLRTLTDTEGSSTSGSLCSVSGTLSEAADVAAFAMMIADQCGLLEE